MSTKDCDLQVFLRALKKGILGLQGRHAWKQWNVDEETLKHVKDGYLAAIHDAFVMLDSIESGASK